MVYDISNNAYRCRLSIVHPCRVIWGAYREAFPRPKFLGFLLQIHTRYTDLGALRPPHNFPIPVKYLALSPSICSYNALMSFGPMMEMDLRDILHLVKPLYPGQGFEGETGAG